jgi:hypothetical protein
MKDALTWTGIVVVVIGRGSVEKKLYRLVSPVCVKDAARPAVTARMRYCSKVDDGTGHNETPGARELIVDVATFQLSVTPGTSWSVICMIWEQNWPSE